MTEQVQEEQANPYNQKKAWHDTEDKPFVSSESMFFEEPSEKNKLFKSNDITEVEAEGSVNTEELETSRDTPYKKPDYKKRYDDLKKHYDSKLNEFKQREVELQNQARPEYVAPKTPEELERFKKEYPDFYEVVETVSHLQSDSKVKVLEERLSQLQSEEAKQRKSDAEKRLTERHPDFGDIRRSEDFHEWAKEQHTSIQAWIYDNADDADLASRALDLFKKDMGIDLPKVDRSSSKSKTNAADMVSTKTTVVDTKEPKVWTKREIDAMSMDEFDKYEKEISDAMQNGLISN
jgi:hypothetical protein